VQLGFLFDQSRCSGCEACVLACKQWHSEDEDAIDYITILEQEHGTFPNLRVKWLFLPCFHCADPPCVKVCPPKAISKRTEDGIVIVDQSKCLGGEECGYLCLKACPYDAPRFREQPGAKMEKCDACLDRLAEGKEPICVAACPLYALSFSSMAEIKIKNGVTKEVEGFRYLARVGPSVVFKAKKQ